MKPQPPKAAPMIRTIRTTITTAISTTITTAISTSIRTAIGIFDAASPIRPRYSPEAGDTGRASPPPDARPTFNNHAEEIEAAIRADEIARQGQRP